MGHCLRMSEPPGGRVCASGSSEPPERCPGARLRTSPSPSPTAQDAGPGPRGPSPGRPTGESAQNPSSTRPTSLSWSRPPRSPGRGVPPAGRSRSAPTSALAPPNARWPSGALCPHNPELIPPRTRPSSGWARGRRVTKVVAQEVPDRGRVSGTAAGRGSSPLGTSLPYTPFRPLGSRPRKGSHSYAVSGVRTTPASRGLSGDVHPSCTLLLPGPAAEAWAGEGTGPRPGRGSGSGAVSVQEVGPAEALPLSPGWARLPLIRGNAAQPAPHSRAGVPFALAFLEGAKEDSPAAHPDTAEPRPPAAGSTPSPAE